MTDPVSQPSLSSIRPFLLVWAIYSAGILLGVHFLLFPSGLPERMDFRQLYAGGYLARTDPANLYEYARQKEVQDALVSKAEGLLPFIRPPYEAWLVSPLTRLPYRRAYVCFLCVNLLLLMASFFVGRDIFSRRGIIAQPRPGLQLFAFFPVTVAMVQGQDSILFLLGLCVVYRVLKAGRIGLAGAVLGLLVFKPQVATPVALFLVARYGISLLAGFAAGGTLVFAASIAVVGWQGFVALVRVLLLTGSVSVSGNLPAGSLGVVPFIMPNLRGLILGLSGWILSGKIIFALTIIVTVCVVLWAVRVVKRSGLEPDAALALATTCAVLVSYYLHIHDLTMMQIPLGLTAGSKNPYISKSTFLFYLAPQFVVLFARNFIYLLAVPAMILAYGVFQMSREVEAKPLSERLFSPANRQ
jgi:glycosyl transferase family 87